MLPIYICRRVEDGGAIMVCERVSSDGGTRHGTRGLTGRHERGRGRAEGGVQNPGASLAPRRQEGTLTLNPASNVGKGRRPASRLGDAAGRWVSNTAARRGAGGGEGGGISAAGAPGAERLDRGSSPGGRVSARCRCRRERVRRVEARVRGVEPHDLIRLRGAIPRKAVLLPQWLLRPSRTPP